MRMPASVAYSEPPATAPCMPRDGRRTSRSSRCGCCPRATAASTAAVTASLSLIWKPLYGIGTRLGAGAAHPVGQTLVQSPYFRQTAPEMRWLSRVCGPIPGGGDQYVSLFRLRFVDSKELK